MQSLKLLELKLLCLFVVENKCTYLFRVLSKKISVHLTLAALTALTFSSISTKATLTFSELSWRQYFNVGRSCSNNGWLNLLSKIIGRHYKKGER